MCAHTEVLLLLAVALFVTHGALLATRIDTLAGTTSGFADGLGPSAKFSGPGYGVIDSVSGAVYIADCGNNRIRKVEQFPNGSVVVRTVAGSSSTAGSADGSALSVATFSYPVALALDSVNQRLYVADLSNTRVRVVYALTSSATVGTVVGSTSGYTDGAAASAKFAFPIGIASDPLDPYRLYVADGTNNVIRMVSLAVSTFAAVTVSTIAGNGTAGFADSSTSSTVGVMLQRPYFISVDPLTRHVLVADYLNNRIRLVRIVGGVAVAVETVAGNGTAGYNDRTTGSLSMLNNPEGVVATAFPRRMYIADRMNNRIRYVVNFDYGSSRSYVGTLAGNGTVGLANGRRGGSTTVAMFNNPTSICATPNGSTVVVVDHMNNAIRKIDVSLMSGSTSSSASQPLGTFSTSVSTRFSSTTSGTRSSLLSKTHLTSSRAFSTTATASRSESHEHSSSLSPSVDNSATCSRDAASVSIVVSFPRYPTAAQSSRTTSASSFSVSGRMRSSSTSLSDIFTATRTAAPLMMDSRMPTTISRSDVSLSLSPSSLAASRSSSLEIGVVLSSAPEASVSNSVTHLSSTWSPLRVCLATLNESMWHPFVASLNNQSSAIVAAMLLADNNINVSVVGDTVVIPRDDILRITSNSSEVFITFQICEVIDQSSPLDFSFAGSGNVRVFTAAPSLAHNASRESVDVRYVQLGNGTSCGNGAYDMAYVVQVHLGSATVNSLLSTGSYALLGLQALVDQRAPCPTTALNVTTVFINATAVPPPVVTLPNNDVAQTSVSVTQGISVLAFTTTASSLARLSSLMSILDCQTAFDEANGKNDIGSGIFPLTLGSGPNRAIAGAVAANLIVVATVSLVLVAMAVGLTALRRVTFREATLILHLPSSAFSAAAATLPSAVSATVGFFFHASSEDSDLVMGIAMVIAAIIVWGSFLAFVVRVGWISNTFIELRKKAFGTTDDASHNKADVAPSAVSRIRLKFRHYFGTRFRWYVRDDLLSHHDKAQANQFLLQYHTVFSELKYAWYAPVDLCCNVLVGAIVSIPMSNRAICVTVASLNVLLSFIILAIAVMKRPYTTRFGEGYLLATQLLITLCAGWVLGYVASVPSAASDTVLKLLQPFATLAALGSFVKTMVDVTSALRNLGRLFGHRSKDGKPPVLSALQVHSDEADNNGSEESDGGYEMALLQDNTYHAACEVAAELCMKDDENDAKVVIAVVPHPAIRARSLSRRTSPTSCDGDAINEALFWNSNGEAIVRHEYDEPQHDVAMML